jgi:hypothetical protein
MDFQHRVGSKFGGGGVASTAETNAQRRERLRLLALETIDLTKVCSMWKMELTLGSLFYEKSPWLV